MTNPTDTVFGVVVTVKTGGMAGVKPVDAIPGW